VAAAFEFHEFSIGLGVDHGAGDGRGKYARTLAAKEENGAAHAVPGVPQENPRRKREGLQEPRDLRIVVQTVAVVGLPRSMEGEVAPLLRREIAPIGVGAADMGFDLFERGEKRRSAKVA
jgi:hypothetical protein